MERKKIVWQGAVFSFFVLLVAWKLINASLWFDEAVEFYYSKATLGSDMYGKVVSTFQPPLYNVIMHFWLLLSENEWWFRFSGVIFGLAESIGVYLVVEKLCDFKAATISVILLATSYYMTYYLQECAEYALLLGLLPWTIYLFLQVLDNATTKTVSEIVNRSFLLHTQFVNRSTLKRSQCSHTRLFLSAP